MELSGVSGSPYKTPRVQKALPAPFQRPSINAGGQPVRRKWQQIKVMALSQGDVIPDFGRIDLVEDVVQRDPHEYFRIFTNVDGKRRKYRVHDSVLAYAADSE